MIKNKLYLLVCLFFFVFTINARAEGVSLSPSFADVVISDIQNKNEVNLILENKTNTEQILELSVVDFGSLDDSGGIAFLRNVKGDQKKYSLASWIELEKNIVKLSPGMKESLKAYVINKDSLSPGGHYGAILATIKAESQKNNSDSVGVDVSVASLIYVQKMGGEKKSLLVRSVESNLNWWNLVLNTSLKFENNGNIHLIPRGVIILKNNHGMEIGRSVINDGSFRIMPESFRKMTVPLKSNKWWNWPGRYKVIVEYRYDGKEEFDRKEMDLVYFGKESFFIILSVLVFSGGYLIKILAKKR